MKLYFKTSTVKVFAEFTFNKIIARLGWNNFSKYLIDGTNENEKSIKITEQNVKLTNLFYILDRLANDQDLTKGGNLRYNKYPIFQAENTYCYISTQWGLAK